MKVFNGKIEPIAPIIPSTFNGKGVSIQFDLQANFRYAAVEGKLLLG